MKTKQSSAIDVLVAERIRAHRKMRGLSQADLAKKLGVSFQQVQKYENGVNRIGAGRLFELAELFDVPIQALYPESAESVERSRYQTDEARKISEFLVSADGWRLCHTFLKIKDAKLRKTIIALVQEMANSKDRDQSNKP